MSAPTTNIHLIKRLADPCDDRAWAEFFSIYAGLIRNFAMSCGAGWQLADEVLQETMVDLALRQMRRFTYGKRGARFSTYLFRVVYNRTKDAIRRQRDDLSLHAKVSDESSSAWIDRLDAGRTELEKRWALECLQALKEEALARVRQQYPASENTMQAYLAIEDGESAPTVAKRLGLAHDTVYKYHIRVRERLQLESKLLRDEWGL